jgi:hypothetical protein
VPTCPFCNGMHRPAQPVITGVDLDAVIANCPFPPRTDFSFPADETRALRSILGAAVTDFALPHLEYICYDHTHSQKIPAKRSRRAVFDAKARDQCRSLGAMTNALLEHLGVDGDHLCLKFHVDDASRGAITLLALGGGEAEPWLGTLRRIEQALAAHAAAPSRNGRPPDHVRHRLHRRLAVVLNRAGLRISTHEGGPYNEALSIVYRLLSENTPSWRTWSPAVKAVLSGRYLWCDYEAEVRLFQCLPYSSRSAARTRSSLTDLMGLL